MNLWLITIVLGAIALLVYEFRTISRRRANQKAKAALPGLVELYCSAIQSGVSLEEAFSYVSEFKVVGLEEELNQVERDLAKGHSFDQAMDKFRDSLGIPECDRFLAILKLTKAAGGQNLVSNLQSLARELRDANSSDGAIESRLTAILVVAKMSLFAPWVLVVVLSVNEQSRTAYLSDAGSLLLLMGFLISVVAYRLVMVAGQTYRPSRILVGENA